MEFVEPCSLADLMPKPTSGGGVSTRAQSLSVADVGTLDEEGFVRHFAGVYEHSPLEFERFTALNDAYEQRFGFPLIVAVRAPGQSKETILQSGFARLEKSPLQERTTALVEIAKIANSRLSDVVAEPAEPAQAVVA